MIMASDNLSQTITITPLFSGSSGNAILVSTADTLVLVDAGMNCKKIVEALNIVKINPFDLSAILITHDHSDLRENSRFRSMPRKTHGPEFTRPRKSRTFRAWITKSFRKRSLRSEVSGSRHFPHRTILQDPAAIAFQQEAIRQLSQRTSDI